MNLTGIILAGGESTRMGQEKALIRFEGERLIQRSLSILDHFCDSILISSNNKALEIFGYEVVEDDHHRIGPIAGFFAALKASQSEHHLVIPCDTPFVNTRLYKKILRYADNYEVVIAGTEDLYTEPLIGYYHRSVLDIFKKQIQKGMYKLHDALNLMNGKVEIFKDKHLFTNINSPDDLSRLEQSAHLLNQMPEKNTTPEKPIVVSWVGEIESVCFY